MVEVQSVYVGARDFGWNNKKYSAMVHVVSLLKAKYSELTRVMDGGDNSEIRQRQSRRNKGYRATFSQLKSNRLHVEICVGPTGIRFAETLMRQKGFQELNVRCLWFSSCRQFTVIVPREKTGREVRKVTYAALREFFGNVKLLKLNWSHTSNLRK